MTRKWTWLSIALVVGVLLGLSMALAPRWLVSRGDARLFLFIRTETGSTRMAKLIMRYSKQYEIDPLALTAIVWKESTFSPKASGIREEGYMGAGDSDRGLMGLYWKTACDIVSKQWRDKALAQKIKESPKILYQPDLNMDIGTCNLRRLLDQHKSVHDIWDAYMFHNSGDKGKGSLKNVTAAKDRYWYYRRKLKKFDWRKAR